VIVRFDLTDIPPNATVVSAVFGIYEESIRNNAQIITLYRLTESWTRLGSGWNKRDGTHNWTAPGGTCDNTRLGSFHPTSAGFKTFDVTCVVQDWVNGTYANNGFILVAKMIEDMVGVQRRRQEEVNFEAPHLDLTYTLEGTMRMTPPASNRWPISSSRAVSTQNKGENRRSNIMFRLLSRIGVGTSV